MQLIIRLLAGSAFEKLDLAIGRLRDVRDSYRALNVEIYGEEIAKILNDV